MTAANLPTLADLKAQLNITDDADDTLLTRVLGAAVGYVAKLCPDSFADTATVPEPVKHATLMHAAALYENREAATYGTGAMETAPLGFDDLIGPYRGWAF
ncbi:head-tail connector protein [Rhodoplanes roseus]|uniref:DNA-packaging protein n=1 Tax=Rhodoplanes roseus TaxID=29409 RepID=A0A327L0J2_9BRAD|nr:head-tail connector protein [Rhodoplanes roseus]RAI43981.1 hypothetical protein CH341_11425 [Rhodoplanes roseus]